MNFFKYMIAEEENFGTKFPFAKYFYSMIEPDITVAFFEYDLSLFEIQVRI